MVDLLYTYLHCVINCSFSKIYLINATFRELAVLPKRLECQVYFRQLAVSNIILVYAVEPGGRSIGGQP
jgi:hypothetical protein